ncbi:MAG: Peptidase family [Alphaproteobacteria bacterium]|jgi:hypothetical protein|nr:Peptidase family [Alphaproteobacteria bacterium]
MPPYAPKRIPLTGTAGDDFFQRQLDDHSCGPACMTTVGRIYGTAETYEKIRALLTPSPATGTPQGRMAELGAALAPQETTGAHTYAGGVAIANIMQEGEGHYVVFLARENDQVLYYEPYYHELVIDHIDNIVWDSGTWDPGSARESHWTANYAPLSDNSFEKWLALAADQNKPPAPRPAAPQAPVP